MSDLPAPLTPADCDLRGLEWMPLYGDRLFSSETWLLASPEGKVAALALWWAAWKQAPAGSLPDNDRVLSQLAGYGVAVKAWQAIREEAMRGWVLCSDGRLYHRVVCELAVEAWDRRVRDRERKAKYRAGRDGDKARDGTRTETGTERGQGADGDVPVRADRTGEDRTGQDLKKDPPAPAADAAGEPTSSRPRNSRAHGTSPRQIAEATRASAPPPAEPDHPLWPKCRAKGVSATDFRHWIAPLIHVVAPDGRPVLIAPSRFHASHVRSEFAVALEHALGQPPDIRANPEAAANG